ncbi:MAG: hypothetical protein AAB440_00915 [Patescibacteria group bacterium]
MSSGHGGDRVPREWTNTNINHREGEGGSYNTNISYERGGGDGGHGAGHHNGKRWGWGKTLLLIGAMAGVGAAAYYGGRAVEAGNAENAGEPSRGEGPEDGGSAAPAAAPAETPRNNGVETVTEQHEGAITVDGNIGQLEMELPGTYTENQEVMVTLLLENQAEFRACEGDLGCADALDGIPNTTNLGVLTGVFAVVVPEGEPNKRMISRSVPAQVTWRGRTITINPDTTRVRVGDGEIVPLREVLGEPRT